MSLFARTLAKCGKDVTFEKRDMAIRNGQASEKFTDARDDRAVFKTLRGVTVFDGTNTERVATHKLCLAYRADIVATEDWVRRVGTVHRLRILTVENCCEDDRTLILMCTDRGEDDQVVNRG